MPERAALPQPNAGGEVLSPARGRHSLGTGYRRRETQHMVDAKDDAAKAGFPLPLTGSCRCGRLRTTVTAEPRFIFACHCRDCQQLTSSAFSLGLVVDKASFTIEGGPHVWTKTADSGRQSHQFTCPDCTGWTHTVAESTPDIVIVRPTTLHDHRWVRPVAQIFTRSALPWALMPVQFSFTEGFTDPAPLTLAFAAGGIRPDRT
jgi:hypothetical protein